ncbi:MAG: 1-deoxy-D-xylulose-5-phosphate reductoisomerase [Rhodocyclaceae bacterium]|nr:1-deoxy-D-xylulose-5-phosphate reductoisomerase [Rhodocyclaceae bacterium]
MTIGLTVLGATGSIGTSTLDVVARHPERFRVVALTGHSRLDVLAGQCRRFQPAYAVVATAADAERLGRMLADDCRQTRILHGAAALEEVASLPETDAVMAAIVGAAGLPGSLAAARAGKRILLANKESLVMAGPVFMAEVARSGAALLPIDSEHNAIFQSLPIGFSGNFEKCGIRRLILTASGGPFRNTPREDLARVTPEAACAHPNWVMGRKISVDSATMMNKGLEVIEAHWLFGAAAERISVVIHPQSIVHSMVEYEDGSVLAQLGNPDMRTPIAHALGFPDRIDAGVGSLDLFAAGPLAFEPPDLQRFPCLALAFQALEKGGNAPAVLNAANEVAVAAFLDGHLPFLSISEVIADALDVVEAAPLRDMDDVLEADRRGRAAARSRIGPTH